MASLTADEIHPSVVQEPGMAGDCVSATLLCGRYAPSTSLALLPNNEFCRGLCISWCKTVQVPMRMHWEDHGSGSQPSSMESPLPQQWFRVLRSSQLQPCLSKTGSL